MRFVKVEGILVSGILVIIVLILWVAIDAAREVEREWEQELRNQTGASGGSIASVDARDVQTDASGATQQRQARNETERPPRSGGDAALTTALDEVAETWQETSASGAPPLPGPGLAPMDSASQPPGPNPALEQPPAEEPSDAVSPPERSRSTESQGAEPEPPAEPEPAETYLVQAGDTFSGIAERVYGRSRLWRRILEANPEIESPEGLQAGMRLTIPPAPAPQAAGEQERAAPDESRDSGAPPTELLGRVSDVEEYRVRQGDNLFKIAREHYGSDAKWRDLLAANQDRIRNPDQIVVGLVLRLPR